MLRRGCWKGKGRKWERAANQLHTGWGVGQARGAYGCGPLTQPGEDVLPSEGRAERWSEGKQLSKKMQINRFSCS